MTTIFLTGATGYVGGEILHEIATRHTSVTIRALVRSREKAGEVLRKYSQVTLVEGDLDDVDLLKAETSKARLVINAADAKHVVAVQSIADGIRNVKSGHPVFWLQISGASVLAVSDIKRNKFGESNDEQYDDFSNVSKVRELIKATESRAVDRSVLSFAEECPQQVRTALIFPPIIYGRGRGPGNTRSIQIPTLCTLAISQGISVFVGHGEACWGNVHIADVSRLAASLVSAALRGNEEEGLWNQNGLYLVQTGEMNWRTIAEEIAKAAKAEGILVKTKSVSSTEADNILPHGNVLFGTNARGLAERGRKLLDYEAAMHNLKAEIPYSLRRELTETPQGGHQQ